MGERPDPRSPAPTRWARFPLRTHTIHSGEDLAAVIRRYTHALADPGDVVVLAESVVAIAQGRAVLPAAVRPRLLARILCLLPDPNGSLATPAAMEVAIREVGTWRILLGVLAAGWGRLRGRRGDFYRVAGMQLAQIDDIGGTMAPFDRYIVPGPKDPHGTARRLKEATGLDVAIADADDRGHVAILACTGGIGPRELEELLRDNPSGNADEQTPLVLLKRTGPADGASPSAPGGPGPGRAGGGRAGSELNPGVAHYPIARGRTGPGGRGGGGNRQN